MTVESEPADYVRVEIRRGSTTTVYELEAGPDRPLAVSEEVDTDVVEVAPDGFYRRFVPGATTLDLSVTGKMTHAERLPRS